MLLNINHQIWYKVCRPLRIKYKLSTNCLMVLNGAYVYGKYVKGAYTTKGLLNFCSYYNNVKMGTYIKVLYKREFLQESGLYRGHQLYSISSKGIEVIKELNQSYEVEFNKFIEQYNISL